MVGRLTLAVLCLVLAARTAEAQDPYNLTAPVPNLATIFTDLFGPRGLDRGQPGDAARRAGAHRALRQRLPVQLQPVQHRARQPAGERAAAVAGRRLHLRVRSDRSACSSARRRASARSSPIAPRRLAPGGCRWGSRCSGSPSTRWRASTCSGCPPSSRTTTRSCSAGARTWSRPSTRSRRTSTSPPCSSRWASPTASTCRWPCRSSRPICKSSPPRAIQRLGTTNELTHFFRQSDGSVGTDRLFTAVGSASGLGDLMVRLKATAFKRASERGRGRPGRAAADRRRDEPARQRRTGAAAVRDLVGDLSAGVAARERQLSLERIERAGGEPRDRRVRALPRSGELRHRRGRQRQLAPDGGVRSSSAAI